MDRWTLMLFLEHFFEIMRSAKRELHDVLLKLIAFVLQCGVGGMA